MSNDKLRNIDDHILSLELLLDRLCSSRPDLHMMCTSSMEYDELDSSRICYESTSYGNEEDILVNKILDVKKLIAELYAARDKQGAETLRYGEMLKDGLLDMAVGVGYDEQGAHMLKIDGMEDEDFKMTGMVEELQTRGFIESQKLAKAAFKKAGKPFRESESIRYFVKKNAIERTSATGDIQQADAVISLISNNNEHDGSVAADAFKSAMVDADVSFYTGHGRYGTGPDFDKNHSVTVVDQDGSQIEVDDYAELTQYLTESGAPHKRSPWQEFTHQKRGKQLLFDGHNKGNIYLNNQNPEQHKLTAKLMYWNLGNSSDATQLLTGKGNPLAQMVKQSNQDYRLWAFSGCTTDRYTQNVRNTPGMDTHSTDIISTSTTTKTGHAVQTFSTFLDALFSLDSASEIISKMNQTVNKLQPGRGSVYSFDGAEDSPIDTGN